MTNTQTNKTKILNLPNFNAQILKKLLELKWRVNNVNKRI